MNFLRLISFITRKSAIIPLLLAFFLASCDAYAISSYAFPDQIDPSAHYLFYLHGKIVEDQGMNAVSPEFGEYQYLEILDRLGDTGLVVVSEQRPKDADPLEYAQITSGQVTSLLKAGVPPGNITVVGASKGAGIAIFVSNLLANEQINYVLLAICDPLTVDFLAQGGIALYGNVLSIYDETDSYAGSCENLFSASAGYGLEKHEEIVLHMNLGHGILYQPYDEWLKPTLEWAK